MDSIDAGTRRTSEFGKKGKMSRKGAHNGDAGDTPALREARILAYMSRAEKGKETGRPVNIFTGEEYTDEELKVEEIEDCDYE